MSSSFKANFRGIGDMLKSDEMQAEMDARAHRVLEVAVATAPFDPGSTDGSHYKELFSVEKADRPDRAGARVVNSDVAALQIEFGTKKTPAHHTLTRALDAAGDA